MNSSQSPKPICCALSQHMHEFDHGLININFIVFLIFGSVSKTLSERHEINSAYASSVKYHGIASKATVFDRPICNFMVMLSPSSNQPVLCQS